MIFRKEINDFAPSQRASMLLLIALLSCLAASSAFTQKLPSQDPGHQENARIAGLKYSVPKRFDLKRAGDASIAIMKHQEYQLTLFVTVPAQPITNDYLIKLSNTLAPQVFSAEENFAWKVIPNASGSKVSKYQKGAGNTKGFNGKKFIQTDYIIIKVHGQYVLAGYVTALGGDRDGKFLFDLDGVAGSSMPGWYAQAHIIASLTGERYAAINPGTLLTADPRTGAPIKSRQ